MGLKFPDALELEVLIERLTPAHTLKLYGNDYTPANGSTSANFTELAGGGYINRPLTFAGWTITAGTPTLATYTGQVWLFTGAVNAPGTVYGYYITRNVDGKLLCADRFPPANVPFLPVNGSKIALLPKISVESQF